MVTKCRVCGNKEGNKDYSAREMMLGTRHEFDYFQCASCGCLQIAKVPENLGDYYPEGYYSFRKRSVLSRNLLRALIDRRRVEYHLGGRSLVGRLADRLAQPLIYPEWVKLAGVSRESRILDVGCGGGKLLIRMALGGFRNCMGLDPFLTEDLQYPNGVSVYKRNLIEFSESHPEPFDLIMFHHSFEHLVNGLEILQAAAGLLNKGGCVLIRIPLADSYCWEHYRENWVNLDAPRHLYLHTNKSMGLLADQAGLVVERVVYDSNYSQLSGSELYKKGISMDRHKTTKGVFSAEQLARFREQAQCLNASGKGDIAAFYLRKREQASLSRESDRRA